jgi:hypothetical protein
MDQQKQPEVVSITPPPKEQQVSRRAYPYPQGHKRDRYALPSQLESSSPIGYRTRISLSMEDAQAYMPLLTLTPPQSFVEGMDPPSEQSLFEESSLGILSSRQSTNFYGQKQRTLVGDDHVKITQLLSQLKGNSPVLNQATYTHVILSRAYRTPFTMLLTLAGHKPVLSLLSVPWRI